MRFLVLGPVGVLGAGRRVALARGHQRTILAVLLAADGEVVTTDRLIDALWDSTPPGHRPEVLQSHVSRLRHELESLAPGEPNAIRSAADGYRLDLTQHGLDTHQFSDLAVRAAQTPDAARVASFTSCWITTTPTSTTTSTAGWPRTPG